jgi:hypothetical protein
MNEIRGGRVTSYTDGIQPQGSSEQDRSLDRVKLVNALKAQAGRSSREFLYCAPTNQKVRSSSPLGRHLLLFLSLTDDRLLRDLGSGRNVMKTKYFPLP